jgi:hypothetical protein
MEMPSPRNFPYRVQTERRIDKQWFSKSKAFPFVSSVPLPLQSVFDQERNRGILAAVSTEWAPIITLMPRSWWLALGSG